MINLVAQKIDFNNFRALLIEVKHVQNCFLSVSIITGLIRHFTQRTFTTALTQYKSYTVSK